MLRKAGERAGMIGGNSGEVRVERGVVGWWGAGLEAWNLMACGPWNGLGGGLGAVLG